MTAHLFISLDRIADLLAAYASAADADGRPAKAGTLRRLAAEVRAVDATPGDGLVRAISIPPEGVDYDLT